MRYAKFTQAIAGDGADAWTIHSSALERQQQGEDVILLSVGDPDFDTPEAIVDSAVYSLRGGETHYSWFTGDPELRRIIAQQHLDSTGANVDGDHVVILAGAQCALYAVAQCLLDPGDEIIVPDPAYVTYEAVIGATGATMVRVPLHRESGFRLDPSQVRDAVTPNTRALLLNSPHNPTGCVYQQKDLIVLANIAKEFDLWVISDEVYCKQVFTGSHLSIAGVEGMTERTVVINSLSKSHAMTGWRLGWAIGPKLLSQHLSNLNTCMLYGCPPFVQRAAVTALTTPMPELADMNNAYRARRDLVVATLASAPGLRVFPPAGGMFVMVDVSATGLSAHEFAWQLLQQQGVSVLAGEAFGPSAAGLVRLSLCVDQDLLRDACRRIQEFAARLPSVWTDTN